jgi:hypothetical protein
MPTNKQRPSIEGPIDVLSRRDLLRAVGLTAGAAMLLGTRVTAAAAELRAYTSGKLALELDGTMTYLRSAEGGNAVVDVIDEPVTEDLILRKHPGGLHFEDILLQTPLAGWLPLAGWIAATLTKGPVPKSGALVYMDFNNNEIRRLEFFNAIITEVALPACDAASKDAIYLSLRLSPESTRLVGGSGKSSTAAAMATATANKNIMGSSFKLNIQGLEPACIHINKVAALTAKRGLLQSQGASVLREQAGRHFMPLDCSALSITLPEQDAGPFYAWFTDFAIKGNNSSKAERAARLEWQNVADGRTVAFADLGNLGIVRFAPVAASTGSETIARVQVDMYCETINMVLAT